VTLPLVSVITPSIPSRHEKLLNRCMPSVQAQTYRNIVHVIVADGPDPELHAKLADGPRFAHPVVFIQLGERAAGNRWGTAARLTGIEATSSDFVAYIDDDDALRPEHVQLHVKALEAAGAAWSYSVMASYSNSGLWTEIGWGPPQYGQIGTPMIVHRRSTLEHGTWGPASATEDWELVQRWITAGLEHVHVPAVTVDVWPSAYWG
jgi:glycosyltransferase involved in cell wall biosynthesis